MACRAGGKAGASGGSVRSRWGALPLLLLPVLPLRWCCIHVIAFPRLTAPLALLCAPAAAATCMGLAAAAFTDAADWHFPRAMVLPLVYWIVVCSVMGYYAVTWAMRHLPASQVGLGGGSAAVSGGLGCTAGWRPAPRLAVPRCLHSAPSHPPPHSLPPCPCPPFSGPRRWLPSSACSPSLAPCWPSWC